MKGFQASLAEKGNARAKKTTTVLHSNKPKSKTTINVKTAAVPRPCPRSNQPKRSAPPPSTNPSDSDDHFRTTDSDAASDNEMEIVESGPVLPKAGQKWLSDVRWRSTFIPSLNHALFASDEPFVHFKVQSDAFQQTVQTVFNVSFPNVRYTVVKGDAVFEVVRHFHTTTVNGANKSLFHMKADKRIREKRSIVANAVLNTVKTIFASKPYVGHPKKIRKYVLWAIGKPQGAFFLNTVPESADASVEPSAADVSHVRAPFF